MYLEPFWIKFYKQNITRYINLDYKVANIVW
jgi:hypothetical protein